MESFKLRELLCGFRYTIRYSRFSASELLRLIRIGFKLSFLNSAVLLRCNPGLEAWACELASVLVMMVLSSGIVSVVRVLLASKACVSLDDSPEKKNADASLLLEILRPSFLIGANGKVTSLLALHHCRMMA